MCLWVAGSEVQGLCCGVFGGINLKAAKTKMLPLTAFVVLRVLDFSLQFWCVRWSQVSWIWGDST